MIIVTGGSGKLGRACIRDLQAHGYEVANIDQAPPNTPGSRFSRADLTDFGQTMAALAGIDERVSDVTGVVHLAAIPAPGLAPNPVTFAHNTVSTYNVFEAARQLGIRNVVWASSETVYGLPFAHVPQHVPLDETIRRPETAYSLSKAIGEEMAEHFCRWDPTAKIIGLRFSNVMEPADYAAFPSFDANPALRRWNLWSYIDARDGAQAIRLALASGLTGAHVFGIANGDTVMSQSNADLLDAEFPDAPQTRPLLTHETLISIDKARDMLGYHPRFSWRGGDENGEGQSA